MKTRILSYLLVFSMILALLPASALAEEESTTTPHITATVEHALDSGGAEKLLGQGDMLFSPVGAQKPLRIQGCFVSDSEIESVVDFVKNSRSVIYDDSIAQEIERSAVEGSKSSDSGSNDDEGSGDPMMNEAIKCVVEAGQASTSLLQRRLRLGYARAGRLIDEMEQMGIVGPHEGSKPRQVLITYAQWLEMNMQKQDIPGDA